MRISIFGLGYVGIISAACLAREGHEVLGVDLKENKVASINEGRSPIIEPELEPLLKEMIEAGLLRATEDASEAINHAEIVIVCVGTPSLDNGGLDLSYVRRVCAQIGSALQNRSGKTTVVIRSTMLPGTSSDLISIIEDASGKKVGEGFGFAVNPEFLREGHALYDFDHPPFTIIGASDDESSRRVAALYEGVEAPLFHVDLGTGEMIKYASNAFHALKVVFANEIGTYCKKYGIDSHQVMDIFVQDHKLNLSPYYLKPGFAFGGSCLGKDLRALLHSAKDYDLDLPVLSSILPSNQMQIQRAVSSILSMGKRRVAILGLSFKPNTDDLRESPSVELVEQLIGKGFRVQIFDNEVFLSQLYGSNREYIERVLPHIGDLLGDSLLDVVEGSEVVIVTKHLSEHEKSSLLNALTDKHILFDFVRLGDQFLDEFSGEYYGIAW